ncbi:GNAT family N-acetyltransferase [Micrococcales bacterium 31B]|nr:GNAT family N-acetyltransferase [Micrococcales bacterium 31B]
MQSVPRYQPRLVSPTASLREQFLAAVAEFKVPFIDIQGAGGFRLPDPTVDFDAWLHGTLQLADRAEPAPDGLVKASAWWVVDDGPAPGTVLGFIQVRHTLSDFLLNVGGHVGYAVTPSARRQGIATFALGAIKPLAAELGIDSLLVTCDQTNEGSRRTIEKCGGVLEDLRQHEGVIKRRYWVPTSGA